MNDNLSLGETKELETMGLHLLGHILNFINEQKKVADDVIATHQHKVVTQQNEIDYLKEQIDKNNQHHWKEMTEQRDFANGINQELIKENEGLEKEIKSLSMYKRLLAESAKTMVASTTKPISETISDLITYGKKSFGNSVPLDYFIESLTKVGEVVMEGEEGRLVKSSETSDQIQRINETLRNADSSLHQLIESFGPFKFYNQVKEISDALLKADDLVHEYAAFLHTQYPDHQTFKAS
jgi:hypothetical protein